MRVLQKSSEDEMILEFLKAEYTSVRFSSMLKNVLWDFGCDRNIIFSADLQDRADRGGGQKSAKGGERHGRSEFYAQIAKKAKGE